MSRSRGTSCWRFPFFDHRWIAPGMIVGSLSKLHLVANVHHQHVLAVIELGLQLFRRDSQDPNPRS